MNRDYVAIVVVHNHTDTIGPTMEALLAQDPAPSRVIVIDCGSRERSWHESPWVNHASVTLQIEGNLGFTGGNNLGFERLNPSESTTLFINPDVVLPAGTVAKLLEVLWTTNDRLGAVSPRLMHYDFERRSLSGRLDSTGVFQRWSGGWFDRVVGPPPPGDRLEVVPALCGAFMLIRTDALRACLLNGHEVFDARYFAYKEDIELSLRLNSRGWSVGVWHGAEAWHGRGWPLERSKTPRELRLRSAENEILLHRAYKPWRVPGSCLKWIAVAALNR